MLNQIPREAQAYADLYHGKTLVLKASGAEIQSEYFQQLAADIRDLTARGVRIVLTFGGGDQISRHYAGHTSAPRQKIDGVGVTTRDVLQYGVLPAYEEIRAKLQQALPQSVFVNPDQMVCDPITDSRYGLVGIPREVRLPDSELSIVGFAGSVDGQPVNVNADDVAKQIAMQYRDEVEELILLTGTGGVLNKSGTVVPLLTDTKMDDILSGSSDSITVDGGMLKKMQAVRDILTVTGKAVITRTDRLEKELLQWMGDGTMCVDTKQLASSPIQLRERHIFNAVYEQHVENGIFRPRPADELRRLRDNHHMVRVKKSPLGGFSAVPDGEWLELSAVWAGTIGNGIGRMVMDSAVKEAGRRNMYALSANEDAVEAFRKHGAFEERGSVSEARGSDGVPPSLLHYDTSTGRDPRVFVAKKRS
jgi:acetylglutamate kinase/GNAT superfamily N-acetyltransferase